MRRLMWAVLIGVAGFAPARAQEAAKPLRLTEAEFARRRDDLAKLLPDGDVALDAGPLGQVGSDANTSIFDFKYLSGIHDDEGICVISGGKTTVFVRDTTKTAAGIDAVLSVDEFEKWAAETLAKRERVYTKLRGKNLEALRRAAPELKVVGTRLRRELTRLRLIKGGQELRLMRKAADATCAAHRNAMRSLRPEMNEKAVQDLIERTFRKEGCPELGFPSICGSGKNGTVLHYMKNNQKVPPETLMVIDIGAAIENYVSDITRTLPTSGTFSRRQRIHYQCVLDAQKAAEKILRPGVTFIDLERAARQVFTDRGLTKWSYAHSRDRSVRHGLGHYVGMAVHDSGTYREKFRSGMVITIEPGWYDKDNGYGIRIEDIYLITKDGFERLSASAPREIEAVEKMMKSGREF